MFSLAQVLSSAVISAVVISASDILDDLIISAPDIVVNTRMKT